MSSKFVSFLEAVGKDIEKGLVYVIPVAGAGLAAFAPEFSPLFTTVSQAVITAEQNFAAIGQQSGTGVSKLAAVTGVVGNLISTALKAAGKQGSTAEVQSVINGIVTMLNAIPAPAPAQAPAPASS